MYLFITILIIVGLIILLFSLIDAVNINKKPYLKHKRFKTMINDGPDLEGEYEAISTSHSYCANNNWIIEVEHGKDS